MCIKVRGGKGGKIVYLLSPVLLANPARLLALVSPAPCCFEYDRHWPICTTMAQRMDYAARDAPNLGAGGIHTLRHCSPRTCLSPA